jgi:hypothetical protein
MASETIHHEINRNLKNISAIAYMLPRGEFLTSYIVTSYDFKSFHNHLEKCGVRFDIGFVLKSRQKPHFNAEIFKDYITLVFILYLNKLRFVQKFAN